MAESDIMAISSDDIKNRIYTIRGVQVMIDADLAELYQVDTKALNQAVRRNIERFPERFCFQLSESEKNELVTNCDRLSRLKHSSVCPLAFSESGIAMLSSILHSAVAVRMSIQIMDAFVEMRHFISQQYGKLDIKYYKKCHDRYIILDGKILYHCGASIKDAGKQLFSIDIIEEPEVLKLLKDTVKNLK